MKNDDGWRWWRTKYEDGQWWILVNDDSQFWWATTDGAQWLAVTENVNGADWRVTAMTVLTDRVLMMMLFCWCTTLLGMVARVCNTSAMMTKNMTNQQAQKQLRCIETMVVDTGWCSVDRSTMATFITYTTCVKLSRLPMPHHTQVFMLSVIPLFLTKSGTMQPYIYVMPCGAWGG